MPPAALVQDVLSLVCTKHLDSPNRENFRLVSRTWRAAVAASPLTFCLTESAGALAAHVKRFCGSFPEFASFPVTIMVPDYNNRVMMPGEKAASDVLSRASMALQAVAPHVNEHSRIKRLHIVGRTFAPQSSSLEQAPLLESTLHLQCLRDFYSLEELVLQSCSALQLMSIAALPCAPHLQALHVRDCSLYFSVASLRPFSVLFKLRQLSLPFWVTPNEQDAAVADLATVIDGLKHLQELQLSLQVDILQYADAGCSSRLSLPLLTALMQEVLPAAPQLASMAVKWPAALGPSAQPDCDTTLSFFGWSALPLAAVGPGVTRAPGEVEVSHPAFHRQSLDSSGGSTVNLKLRVSACTRLGATLDAVLGLAGAGARLTALDLAIQEADPDMDGVLKVLMEHEKSLKVGVGCRQSHMRSFAILDVKCSLGR